MWTEWMSHSLRHFKQFFRNIKQLHQFNFHSNFTQYLFSSFFHTSIDLFYPSVWWKFICRYGFKNKIYACNQSKADFFSFFPFWKRKTTYPVILLKSLKLHRKINIIYYMQCQAAPQHIYNTIKPVHISNCVVYCNAI